MKRFGNYALLHKLARGGMGEVYVAQHGGLAGMEKLCVVKTLRPELSSDQTYIARFQDEARVVVQLSHRNIGQVFDVGQVGDTLYLGMELVAGVDLRTVLERRSKGPFDLDENLALFITTEVLEALSYGHRQRDPVTGESLGVVHRDVSPQNVMVSFEGEVKLIDFGLAQSTRKKEQTSNDEVMGKLSYMSPEQARGDDVDARSDLFSAAVLTYELVTGRRYYDGLDQGQIWRVAGKGVHEPSRFGSLHKALQKVLKKALEPDVSARFPDAEAFREAIDGYVFARGHRAGPRELREFMTRHFDAEIDRHRKVLAKVRDLELPVEDRPEEQTRNIARAGAPTPGPTPRPAPGSTPGSTNDSTTGPSSPARAPPPGDVEESKQASLDDSLIDTAPYMRPVKHVPPPPRASSSKKADGRAWVVLGAGAAVGFALLLVLLLLLLAGGEEQPGAAAAPAPPQEAPTAPPPLPEAAVDAGADEAASEPIREKEARPARRAKRPERARPPAPGLAASDREKRSYLREHCADLPCTERVLTAREDPRATLEEKREAASALSSCVFVCGKR